MLPTVVIVQAEVNLDEGAPFRALRFADKSHAGFLGRSVGLFGITRNAGANDVFPGRRAAAVAGDDVVQIQVLPVEHLAAILADVFVPFENVVSGEFDFLFREPIEHDQKDHARDANPEGNRANAFWMRVLLRKTAPLAETVRLE